MYNKLRNLKQTEYEDKIMKALMQAGIEIIEENKG